MELSWDGSIISMSEVNPPASPSSSSRSPRGPHHPPARTSSHPGLRSAFEGAGNAQAALLPSPPERAYLSSSTRPSPTFANTSPDPPPPLEPRALAPPLAPAQQRPALPHTHSHPLASFLHDSLSPPASPTASIASSSFPGGSRTRLSSCAGTSALSSHEASPRSRSARRRTRARSTSGTRSGSASSTASTDGSAHEDVDRAGELSSEDDHHGHASGLVMPSLHLLDAAGAAPRRSSTPERARARVGERGCAPAPSSARLLVLGKSAEDRRTLARLVVRDIEADDELRRTTSAASVAGATDLSYSYLSFGPSSSSHERSASRSRSGAVAAECASNASAAFEPLAHADAPVALWHPVRDVADGGAAELIDELTRPLERLEAKLSRGYPATTGFAQVVEAAGCGEYEACLFLFSSRASLSLLPPSPPPSLARPAHSHKHRR